MIELHHTYMKLYHHPLQIQMPSFVVLVLQNWASRFVTGDDRASYRYDEALSSPVLNLDAQFCSTDQYPKVSVVLSGVKAPLQGYVGQSTDCTHILQPTYMNQGLIHQLETIGHLKQPLLLYFTLRSSRRHGDIPQYTPYIFENDNVGMFLCDMQYWDVSL